MSGQSGIWAVQIERFRRLERDADGVQRRSRRQMQSLETRTEIIFQRCKCGLRDANTAWFLAFRRIRLYEPSKICKFVLKKKKKKTVPKLPVLTFLRKISAFSQLLKFKRGILCSIQGKLRKYLYFRLLVTLRQHFMVLNTENAEIWISMICCSAILQETQRKLRDPQMSISQLQSLPSTWETQTRGTCKKMPV